MKPLAKNSYGYQKVHRSRKFLSKYLVAEKLHAAKSLRLFRNEVQVIIFLKKLNLLKHNLKTKHHSLLVFPSWLHHFANAGVLLWTLWCKQFSGDRIDTCFVYLAVAKGELEHRMRSEIKAERGWFWSKIFKDKLAFGWARTFLPIKSIPKHRKTNRSDFVFSRRDSVAQGC